MSNEAEATLPKEVIHEIRSSPPISTACSLFEMDDKFVSTSDVSVPQDAQQTPKHPRHKRMESDDTERPASAQQNHDNSEEHSNVDEGQEPSDDEDLDPAAQIADFDWDDLHQRYHEKINACHEEEFKLMQEWESLMEVLLYVPCLLADSWLTASTVLSCLG
jgi:hypothetical protein